MSLLAKNIPHYFKKLCVKQARRQVCFKQTCRRICSKRACKLGLRINLGIMGGLFLCWWVLTHTQLHLCLTPSLEGVRVLLFQKTNSIKQGDIVSIQGHVYKHLGIQPYAKRVIGFSGEPIMKGPEGIKIGSRTLPIMEKTNEGHSLTPLAAQVVPEGYVFVAGDHPRSIDSRYEEFGLVEKEKIYGKGVFAW